jgi:hypothetical protein
VLVVNLTRDRHFYAYDEMLETFGIKYIKENIIENIYDNENLKRQIKASQTERERMDLLFGEFVDDIVISKKDRAVDGRRESFWALVDSLLIAFESSSPTNHSLFQNCKELTDDGFSKLFSCYDKGKERLTQIYRQEVLKIDPINTKGRRAKEVVVTKTKDLKNRFTTTTTTTATTSATTATTSTSTRSRHKTTEAEKLILTPYFQNPNPDDNDTKTTLELLVELSDYWTKTKLKAAWKYAQTKITN